MKEIADTGLIVALLTRNDPHHAWALDAFRRHSPFHTCDAVLAEAASFFPNPTGLLRLVTRGDLMIDTDFSLAREASAVLELAAKYADRPMDLADACLVRMSEALAIVTSPMFSVIIPAHDSVATLGAALDSVRAQGFSGYEVIVVDDGSTDGSAGLARAHPVGCQVVEMARRAGPGAARNAAAKVARGEYLAFLDADDEWYPWLYELFDTHQAGAGIGSG